MISKEEYKNTLVRMWDSVRDDEFKGVHCCDGVLCPRCPLYNNGEFCYSRASSKASYNAYDVITKVEKWAKEHPIETNGSRFLKNYPKAEVCGRGNYGRTYLVKLDKSIPDSDKPYPDDDNIIEVSRKWWDERIDDDADCD